MPISTGWTLLALYASSLVILCAEAEPMPLPMRRTGWRDIPIFFFGEDLLPYPGMQYTHAGQDIFACFSDVLPDRWGRTLLNRREQIAASDEKLP